MRKNKTPGQGGSNGSGSNSNSAKAQRQRLFIYLQEVGALGITTIYAREHLDIIAPAPRVFELRFRDGRNIQTIWDRDTNAQGNQHRVARYVLLPGRWRGAL